MTPDGEPVVSEPDPNLAVKPPSRWDRFRVWVGDHRTRVIIAVGILLVIPAAAFAWYSNLPAKAVDVSVKVAKKAAKPTTVPSPLTGLPVTPEQAAQPIIAVVIENHPDARPQSGLADAGVVYEALAEGGITRFLAFYQEKLPKELGPVRSIRTYFVDWALEFGAPVAHVGGNADALDLIQPTGMKDMNEFTYGDSFYRSTDRYAPHNAYTTGDKLTALATKLGFNKPPTGFKPSPRKKDEPTQTPAHGDVKINYSYNGYQVEYKYDAGCNCYNRFLADQPHIDRNTGQQIQVKNVVVEYMPTSYGTTRIGESTVIMGTPGTGQAIVFRDGTAIPGTWSKDSHTSRTQLKDANGNEIALNAGNTWYSIVPVGNAVAY